MSEVQFETGFDMFEVTMNGMFSGEPDVCARHVRGLPWYRINGRSVTEKEYRAAVAVHLNGAKAEPWPPRWVQEAWESAPAGDLGKLATRAGAHVGWYDSSSFR